MLQVESGAVDHTSTARALRQLASGGIRAVEAWSSIQARLRGAAEAAPNIELRYDTRIQAVGQDEAAAWAVTEPGEIVRADLLIGADGHRSTVRRQVAPHKPDATFAGYLIWVALLEEQALPESYRPRPAAPVTTILEGGADDVYIGSMVVGTDGVGAAGRRRLGWAWYDNRRNHLLRRLGCVEGNVVQHSLRAAEVPAQVLAHLKQEAAQWPTPWQEVTRHSLHTRSFVGLPVAEYVPDTLVAGRMALVGDAAHVLKPITASGFNASLQDAAVLADCLAQAQPGTPTAQTLRTYEAQRLAAVRQLVQSGQAFSRSFGR